MDGFARFALQGGGSGPGRCRFQATPTGSLVRIRSRRIGSFRIGSFWILRADCRRPGPGPRGADPRARQWGEGRAEIRTDARAGRRTGTVYRRRRRCCLRCCNRKIQPASHGDNRPLAAADRAPPAVGLPPQAHREVDEHGEDEANHDHRPDRDVYADVLSFVADVAREVADPVAEGAHPAQAPHKPSGNDEEETENEKRASQMFHIHERSPRVDLARGIVAGESSLGGRRWRIVANCREARRRRGTGGRRSGFSFLSFDICDASTDLLMKRTWTPPKRSVSAGAGRAYGAACASGASGWVLDRVVA